MKASTCLHLPVMLLCFFVVLQSERAVGQEKLSIDGFTDWRTGSDSATRQIIPAKGTDPLHKRGRHTLASAKFKVVNYGEMSFPIHATGDAEAVPVDLSESRYIRIVYRANQELILQLREAGVHGGIQNHIVLPASRSFRKLRIALASFAGGLSPLNLARVAKFNFAFLSNKAVDECASLEVRSFSIDGYSPL